MLLIILHGVYIHENFSCDMHFRHIITASSQRLLHILTTLRCQGFSLELLHCVFYSIMVNKIMYHAISAWYGFLTKSHVLQINNSHFKRAFKYGHVKFIIKLK